MRSGTGNPASRAMVCERIFPITSTTTWLRRNTGS
jgi:hypothetical protein